MRINKGLALIAAATAGALVFTGCGSNSDTNTGDKAAKSSNSETVKIGTVGASEPYWEEYTKAAKAAGIDVEIVDFSDYNQPNPALSAGEIDLNQFQHVIYLAQYNQASGDTLVPIGSTAIYPLALFSEKHKQVSDIPKGATIAIPNDESNRARALLVLQQAGLLKLQNGGNIFSKPADILPEESRVKVTEVDASFTVSSLKDVDGAVVNNDFVTKAGLKFDDALFSDDPNDSKALPYVNIFAAKAADATNPTYLKLVDIYQDTQAVQDGVQKAAGGSAVLLKTSAADLLASLHQVQQDIKNKG